MTCLGESPLLFPGCLSTVPLLQYRLHISVFNRLVSIKHMYTRTRTRTDTWHPLVVGCICVSSLYLPLTLIIKKNINKIKKWSTMVQFQWLDLDYAGNHHTMITGNHMTMSFFVTIAILSYIKHPVTWNTFHWYRSSIMLRCNVFQYKFCSKKQPWLTYTNHCVMHFIKASLGEFVKRSEPLNPQVIRCASAGELLYPRCVSGAVFIQTVLIGDRHWVESAPVQLLTLYEERAFS